MACVRIVLGQTCAVSETPAASRFTPPRKPSATAWTLAGFVLLVVAAGLWGYGLNREGVNIMLEAPPFYGEWDVRFGSGVIAPILVAGAVILAAPAVVRAASWRTLLVAVTLGSFAWPLALALIDSTEEISEPLLVSTQYILVVPDVGDPGTFLSSFTDVIDDYPSHVRSHPPLMVLLLWGLDQMGFGGEWAAAFLILAVAATAGAAVLIALRALAGEDLARRAAPYLILTPAALAIATTADALYMAVAAWAVCALVLALVSTGRRSHVLAGVGGVVFGLTIFLSYGLALMGLIPLAVAVHKRRLVPLLIAGAGVLAVVLAFLAAGFWWVDGYFTTRREYLQSVAKTRPYDFFLVNNLAVYALALGPVVVVALTRLRDRAVWLLVGGALAVVAFANISGMSKAEVERIWLPFLPWIVLATCALPATRGKLRALLGVQALLAIAIGVAVETNW